MALASELASIATEIIKGFPPSRVSLLLLFILYNCLESLYDWKRVERRRPYHVVRRAIIIITYAAYMHTPPSITQATCLYFNTYISYFHSYDLATYELISVSLTGILCLLVAVRLGRATEPHASCARAQPSLTPHEGSPESPSQENMPKGRATSNDTVNELDTHLNRCDTQSRTNGGPDWETFGWQLRILKHLIFLPLTLLTLLTNTCNRSPKKVPLKRALNIDWNQILAAQTDKEIRASLYGIMKNVDRIKAQLNDHNGASVKTIQTHLVDPYAPAAPPTTDIDNGTKLDQDTLDMIKEQVREIQFTQYNLQYPTPSSVLLATDRLQGIRNLNEEDAPYQELVAARRLLDDVIRDRKERRKQWIVNDEDLTTLNTYQAVDQYLQKARYESKYWKDPATKVPFNPEILRGKTKAELRKMLNDKQQRWWDDEQAKKGVKLYQCPDCKLTVKPGHSCLTSTSNKVIYKKGIPIREVTRVTGQDGKIREESNSIVDMDHLVGLVQKALNQASKTQQVLPPIVSSLENLLTNPSCPPSMTPLEPLSRASNNTNAMEIEAPPAITVSNYNNTLNPLLVNPSAAPISHQHSFQEVAPLDGLTIDLEDEPLYQIDPNRNKSKGGNQVFQLKEEGEITPPHTNLISTQQYPVQTVKIDGRDRLVLVLPDHLRDLQQSRQDFH